MGLTKGTFCRNIIHAEATLPSQKLKTFPMRALRNASMGALPFMHIILLFGFIPDE